MSTQLQLEIIDAARVPRSWRKASLMDCRRGYAAHHIRQQ